MHAVLPMVSFVVASTLTIGACVGAPPPPPGAGESSSSTSDSTGLPPVTTAPVEDTSGTVEGTGTSSSGGDTSTGTSSSSGDTTMGVGPTPSDTSSGESSSGTGPPPECLVPTDCPNNQTCNAMGECESVCAASGWGPNDYTYCVTPLGTFDSATICGEAMTCVLDYDDAGDVGAAVCGRSCTTPCDCPAPAASGDAVVSCGNVVGDGANRCHLSCANGETCPDGMTCITDGLGNPSYCTHPVQPIAPYGSCDNFAAGCVAGSTCATNGSNSVCVAVCPGGSVAECPPAPPGADLGVACDTVVAPPGNDCYLDCVISNDCPNGMACINNTGDLLCMWP